MFRMATLKAVARAGRTENLVQAGLEIAKLVQDAARTRIAETEAFVSTHWRATFERHASAVSGAQPDSWRRVFEFH